MTALDDALEHPDVKRIFTAIVTVGREVNFWTLDTGNTYYFDATLPGDAEYSRSWDVIKMIQNDHELTPIETLALCRSNNSTFFLDYPNNRVYIHPELPVTDPNTITVTALYRLFICRLSKVFTMRRTVTGLVGAVDIDLDYLFESRLDKMPNLSMRNEVKFSDPVQIGGGSFSFINDDGYFDQLTDLNWDAGEIELQLGIDRPNNIMAFSDYEVIGRWKNTSWTKTDSAFTLKVSELKANLNRKIPIDVYDRDTYPTMLDDDVGKPVQIAYGKIKDVTPVCVNVNTNTFKLAGHAIVSFDGVRVKNESTGAWEQKTFLTTNTATAEFTLSLSDWASDDEIAVDFTGKPKTGNTPMDNPADIVKDLLQTYLGEPASRIDTTSFDAAYNALDFGGSGSTRLTQARIEMYMDSQQTAKSVIGTINHGASAYLFQDLAGDYVYQVFKPEQGEGLIEFTDAEITNFSESVNSDIISKVIARYDKREVNDWAEVYTFEDASRQYAHVEHSANLKELDTPFSDVESAEYWAQAQINYLGRPQRMYTLSVPSRAAMKLQPGDFVRINYARQNINGTYEVIEVSHNLSTDSTTLKLGDMHTLGDRPGWWEVDAPTFPASLGGGAASPWSNAWTPEQKAWARQNLGYWTDDNGFADPTDADSHLPSSWV